MIYSEYDLEKRYADFLDECYGMSKIGPYEYDTAQALKEVDPIAYRTGFADWLDSELGETLWELPDGDYTDENPSESEAV